MPGDHVTPDAAAPLNNATDVTGLAQTARTLQDTLQETMNTPPETLPFHVFR